MVVPFTPPAVRLVPLFHTLPALGIACLFIVAIPVGVQIQLMVMICIFLVTNEVEELSLCYWLYYDHVNSHTIVCLIGVKEPAHCSWAFRLVSAFVIVSNAAVSMPGVLVRVLWENVDK